MIELIRLSCGYGKKTVLHDVSAVFPSAALTALVGKNGSGKTTLLKAAAGLLPYTGTVLLDGTDSAALSPAARAARAALMPQFRTAPAMTAEELLLCARYPYVGALRRLRKEDTDAVEEAMEHCGVSELRERDVRSLSGGERQRVYFAMALAQGTDILLLDEPTSFLDPGTRFEIFELSRAAAARGKTVVCVTHDLSSALRYADLLLVLDGGELRGAGSPSELCGSGILSEVFGVALQSVETDSGTDYLLRPRRDTPL